MSVKYFAKVAAKRSRVWLLMNFRYRRITVGRGFYCGRNVAILPGSLSAGDYVFIGNYCHLASRTVLGNFVMLASFVSIVGGDHKVDVPGTPMMFSGRDVNRTVSIEDDVWVGHGVIIMHGVTIGEGAIVGAGSVVTRDVPPYTIVAGIPAQPLRDRFAPRDREVHHAMLAEYRATGKLATWRRNA